MATRRRRLVIEAAPSARRASCAVALLLLLLAPPICPLAAQDRSTEPKATHSPEAIISQFVKEQGDPRGRAAKEITRIFIDPTAHPHRTVDALLDGLESVALTGDNSLVRSRAAGRIGMAGWSTSKSPWAGIVARQARVYRKSSDELVRAAIVSSLTGAAETRAAAAFLRTIAQQSRQSEDFPDAPIAAIRAMTRLDEDGPAALRELHESGEVRNANTRQFLKELSKTGYRMPDPRRPPKRP